MSANYDINIYFDESGKASEKLHLMGAISVPKKFYNKHEEILNTIITSSSIHWTSYNGYKPIRENIKTIINTVMYDFPLIKMNIISFDINKIEQNALKIKPHISNIIDRTIYTKFPERVVYGLLRKYGKDTYVNAEIFIEHDHTYEAKEYNLKVEMLQQLNIQSIYRSENFKISSVDYLAKKSSYGIELTDLLLGMVRTIILNSPPLSSRIREKNALVNELLRDNKEFLAFIKTITIYEWNGYSKELIPISMDKYLEVFINANIT